MTTQTPPAALAPRTNALENWFSDGWATTKRNLTKIIRVPEILVFTTIQPIMFVLLFSFVYEGVIRIPGVPYREFIMAGIFAQTVVFGSTYSGSAMAQDLKDGIIDRFRTLPMSPSSVLIGRTSGDLAINGLSMLVMVTTGLIVGWRVDTAGGAVAGIALLLLFSYSFSWIMIFLGMSVRSPEVINNVAFIVLFPITFISNAFVPSESLPGPLRAIAEWNPVSALVLSARQLFGNTPTNSPTPDSFPLQNPILVVLAGIVLVLAVFVPLSLWRYRRITSR